MRKLRFFTLIALSLLVTYLMLPTKTYADQTLASTVTILGSPGQGTNSFGVSYYKDYVDIQGALTDTGNDFVCDAHWDSLPSSYQVLYNNTSCTQWYGSPIYWLCANDNTGDGSVPNAYSQIRIKSSGTATVAGHSCLYSSSLAGHNTSASQSFNVDSDLPTPQMYAFDGNGQTISNNGTTDTSVNIVFSGSDATSGLNTVAYNYTFTPTGSTTPQSRPTSYVTRGSSAAFSAPGTYTVIETVTDYVNHSNSQTLTFTIVDEFTVTCSGSPSRQSVNGAVYWHAQAFGGGTPTTYSWSGAVTGNSQNVTTSYSSPGSKSGTEEMDD